MPACRAAAGFTLVELLVVVGIIAVLVGLLLPSLSRARESANRTRCAANLRELANAFIQYAASNRDHFPAAARNAYFWPEDWLHWSLGRDFRQSAIAGMFPGSRIDENVLRCPSDPVEVHPPVPGIGGRYPYSYAMNPYLECRLPNVDVLAMVYFGRRAKFSRVRNAPDKAMLVEESEATINDGATAIVGFPWPPGAPPIPGPTDWLAVRHDTGVIRPDASAAAGQPIPNPARRGNVAFVDGHVGYVSRRELHDVAGGAWDPTR